MMEKIVYNFETRLQNPKLLLLIKNSALNKLACLLLNKLIILKTFNKNFKNMVGGKLLILPQHHWRRKQFKILKPGAKTPNFYSS